MELKQVIIETRNKLGLSQDEMAAKLYVTRQAVSRWENGETTPNIDSLKMMVKEFGVEPGALLGLTEEPVCQSCGMNLRSFDDLGTDEDGGVHTDYCRFCYQKGAFTNNRTLDEMVESNLLFLDEYNKENGLSYSPEEARVELKRHLATLKRWR